MQKTCSRYTNLQCIMRIGLWSIISTLQLVILAGGSHSLPGQQPQAAVGEALRDAGDQGEIQHGVWTQGVGS